MKKYYQNYDPRHLTEEMKNPYRKGIIKETSQKKIDKVSDRSIFSFNVLYCYFTIPFRPYGCHAVWSFIRSVLARFFIPMYLRKIHVIHTPIKHVDHELDEKVPFRPEYIKIYLDFVNYWIRPLAMLVKRFGTFKGSRLAAEFLRYIKLAYLEAFKVYSHTMTTTYQPECNLKAIKRLRRADPHYMCVPSLHISIVCLTISFYKMLFEREAFTAKEKEKWYSEIYNHGVKIAETVLYLKQHSVNCIPSALYMMSYIAPELFTPEDAVDFINKLFENATDISKQDRERIIVHIQFMYERLLLEGTQTNDWTEPVKRWLDNYKAFTPHYAKE